MKKFAVLPALFLATWLMGATAPLKPVVLERVRSLYNGELSVIDYQGGRYLLAKSRIGEVLHSAMDLGNKDHLILDYLQVMALLTGLHAQPNQVYNLGLGGGELIRFHLHHYEKSRIDSAEIDPNVITVAKRYFDVNDARHRILEGEGFDILKRQNEKYDTIWVDDIISKEGPKAYVRAEHLKALHDRLSDNGVLVANLGEAAESKYFSGVERDYRRGYLYGIRVKSPIPQYARNFEALRAVAFDTVSKSAPALLPTYLIAVGNQPGLNCARFWDTYRKWSGQKWISVNWAGANPEKFNEVCEDLK